MYYCPTWAGGVGPSVVLNTSTAATIHHYRGVPSGFDSGWIELDFVQRSSSSIAVDLAPLDGAIPTAVRYMWGTYDCCNLKDPMLWVNRSCIADCPIYSNSNLPANPFQAKIVGGKCECVPPQVC
jgi:hypothetical protein